MSTFLFPSHRRPAVLALTLCQIAVLSACGGGSDDEAPLASVSSAAVETPVAPDAQALRRVSTRTTTVTVTPVSTGTAVTTPVAIPPAATTSTTVTAGRTGLSSRPSCPRWHGENLTHHRRAHSSLRRRRREASPDVRRRPGRRSESARGAPLGGAGQWWGAFAGHQRLSDVKSARSGGNTAWHPLRKWGDQAPDGRILELRCGRG